MAWDATRPVPYRRLIKEWLIYAAIMMAVYTMFLRDSTSPVGMVLGLAVSLPLWLGISTVLAKFGYQRKTLSDLRAARAAGGGSSTSPRGNGVDETDGARRRPSPTRRTSPGHNNPRRRKRR